MGYRHLSVTREKTTCWLTLDRPDQANALNKEMRTEFLTFLGDVGPDTQAVILIGAGKAFCGGLDLKEGDAVSASNEMWEIAHAIYDSETIFIAAVNGAARGGGVTLINACDLAIASSEASLGVPEIGFGVYATVAGPTTQLAAPKKIAAQMVLTGRPLTAEQARAAFLVNDVCAPEALREEAGRLAEHIGTLDRRALSAAKKGLNTAPFDKSMREQSAALAMELNLAFRDEDATR